MLLKLAKKEREKNKKNDQKKKFKSLLGNEKPALVIKKRPEMVDANLKK